MPMSWLITQLGALLRLFCLRNRMLKRGHSCAQVLLFLVAIIASGSVLHCIVLKLHLHLEEAR